MDHISRKQKTLRFQSVGSTNKRSIDYTALGCFSLKVANSSHIVNISPQASFEEMFPTRRGNHWHPLIPWYKSVFWPDGAADLRVRDRWWRGKCWTVEQKENPCPCSYKTQHINWFHKIDKMCWKPRFVPHTQKKICSKKANVLFWFWAKDLITLHLLHNQWHLCVLAFLDGDRDTDIMYQFAYLRPFGKNIYIVCTGQNNSKYKKREAAYSTLL